MKARNMLLLLCLALLGLWILPAQAQDATSIVAELTADPETGVVGETDFTVTISLHGDAASCPALASNRPVDAALLLDISGSMEGARLDSTRDAAQVFLQSVTLDVPRPADPDATNYTGDQVAIVAFSGDGRPLAPLTEDSATLRSAVDSLSIDLFGGTNIAGGLTAARTTVTDPNTRNPIAARVIVLLSDGEDDNPDAVVAAADLAKSAGVRIVTIGLGEVVEQPSARALLENIASAASDFYQVNEPGDLPAIFQRIAQTIQPTTAGTDILLSYQYDATLFDVDPDSIFPPASQVLGNTITWVYGRIDGGETPQFSFRARARQQGSFPIGAITEGSYKACETNTPQTISGVGPTVVAQLPTPTPLPTATFTPLPTNTPAPTPTATPPAAITGAGFVPATAQESSLTQALNFCADGLGSALPLIILIAVLLLLLLPWLLWHWRRLKRGDCGAACFLMWSLFGLYAAFVIWLFLLPTAASACEQRESIYFWRQEGASRLMGIYLAAPNVSDASSFPQMNANGCVGCHVVSSAANRVAAVQGPPPNQILIRNFDGTIVDVPPEITNAVYMSFSPDGNKLVYSDNVGDLHILDLVTRTTTPLSGASQPNIAEAMPAWGPEGQIAFVHAPDLSGLQYDGLYFDSPVDIYTIPETGGTALPLTGASGDGFNYYPSYSPDGRWLAFTRHHNAITYSDPLAEIYVVPATGGTAIRLRANDGTNGNPIPNASNSWSTWSLDSTQLAFNTKRSDELYDIYITSIDENGQSGIAQPISAAAEPSVFEHTPFWGLPIAQIDVVRNTLALWPFLLPLLPLAMLAWVACRRRTGEIIVEPEPVKVRPLPPPPIPAPLLLKPLTLPWQPQPALIIGLGATGREVLTQLKKTLRDAQLGEMPVRVRLIGLDTGDYQTLQGQTAPINFAGVELDDGEIIELKDNLIRVMDDPDFRADPLVRGWLTDDAIRSIGGEQRFNLREGANKMRLLARAGLIHHLRSADHNFFDRLLDVAPACFGDDGELNVMIVGDTFGDIGSAVLFDVALLVREAASRKNAKAVAITAHLITHEAVRDFTDNPEQDRVNSGATLREIERFQLAEARPFPIFYPQIARDVCDQLPLDDLFLYDGRGLETIDPKQGIFPAVADAIALWLDKASAQGALRQLQSGQRRLISQKQRDNYEVHVFSQGMFTYRLPFADILENVRARFAHDIFHALVTGGGQGNSISLDPAFKREAYLSNGETPDDVARGFLVGTLSVQSNRPAPGYTLAALRAVIDPNFQAELIPALRRLEADGKERMLASLRGALNLLLNGKPETIEVDIFQARGGKLGFTLAFLDALSSRIDRVSSSLDAVRDATDKRDQLKAILSDMKAAASSAQASLEAQAQAIGAASGKKENLNTLLGKRSFNLQTRLDQMAEIKTRHYISTYIDKQGVEQQYAELWYRTYLGDKRGEALRQFYWRVDEQSQTTLLLYGENETQLDPDHVDQFEKALIEVATRYCADIKDNARLADLLDVDVLLPYNVAETARVLAQGSQALLNYETSTGDAGTSDEDGILAVNDTVDVEALITELIPLVGGAEHLKRLNSTDPYSMALNRRLAIVPFGAVTTLAGAREDYRRNHNLSSNPRDRRAIPISTAVYEAEAAALLLEARILNELRLRPDLLHPQVVTALTVPERVTAFALVLASGELGLTKLRGRIKPVLVMYTDSGEIEFPDLFRNRAIASDLHPLAQGLLMFLLDTKLFPDTLIETLMDRFQRDDTLPDIWKQWVDGAWQEWLDQVDENDTRSIDIVTDILKVSRLYANQYRQ